MIDVVVPVNNEDEFMRNPRSSPGLSELSGYIVPVHEAKNAADAWDQGIARCTAPWIIFCHQDVWFPSGSGKAIEAILAKVPAQDEPYALFGTVGVGWRDAGPCWAGTALDRGKLLDWPDSDSAVSIDELCVIMHRTCHYKIDPRLGWHLWGTDLCLQAMKAMHPAKIVRVLLHHNSTLTAIPNEFYSSAALLRKKYPERQIFHTLNGFL